MVLFVGLYLGLLAFLYRWADLRPEPDERHFVTTTDGWTLCLHRFRARGAARDSPPLILGHGLMMNRASWHLSEDGSMINALCEAGYDVFVAEYRGSRSSSGPIARDEPEFWDYSIVEHAYLDLPAIIDGVRKITASERVHWLGHSMGGIAIYLYGSRFGCEQLARVVTLGSPVVFGAIQGPGPAVARLFRKSTPWRKVFRARAALAFVLPLALLLPSLVLRLGLNPKNLGVRARLTLIRGAVEDISTRLLDWFLDKIPGGDSAILIDGKDGNLLAAFTAPLLVVAGGSDHLAPPASVRPAFERVGSQDKHYILLDGRGEPLGAPSFGHSDMPSSPAAVRHLSPLIVQWLDPEGITQLECDVPVTG